MSHVRRPASTAGHTSGTILPLPIDRPTVEASLLLCYLLLLWFLLGIRWRRSSREKATVVRSASILGGSITSYLFPPGTCGIVKKRLRLTDLEGDVDWLIGARTAVFVAWSECIECSRVCRVLMHTNGRRKKAKSHACHEHFIVLYCMQHCLADHQACQPGFLPTKVLFGWCSQWEDRSVRIVYAWKRTSTG